MSLHLYRDDQGEPRARASEAQRLLARFLEGDVQGDAHYAREILAALDQVAHGARPHWQGTGNAHTLTLTPDIARLESDFDDTLEPYSLPLDSLRRAITGWLALITTGR